MLYRLLAAIVIGALSGFAANKLMKGKSEGFLKNTLLGIVGGFVGGFLGDLIGVGDGWISSVLLAIGGSCLVIWLARKFAK